MAGTYPGALLPQPCSNAAKVRMQLVWDAGGASVWPTEQFICSVPCYLAIIDRPPSGRGSS
jgi:hypothetical protein